ncbi:kinase domain protein (macronuclear) [Tetrahymena thermophila SB210]|uniref:Kinase domain protein n=1 Tax=Tetrahymena thermophila (strain SB210) TaxID=312017 RepID=I7MME3_TETTS|nr:kinase domain protein [Tetrahymena thermophila SB210]EAS04687.2 kinase domain protein [Tetrahymena thermophila SB210]|eukprot:XP_001024932.2 kinase domain protein [Tetrahymena thermophila SB210]
MKKQFILLLVFILIAACNSAHVKNKKKVSDNLLNEQNKKSSSKQVQETNEINKEDENKFKHFSDYVKQSNKAQKDFIIQFMEINDLEQYQARFLIMSLLAVFTVALCCFGVKYILNFSKTCKTALSEIKWIKEVEAQQEQQQQNVFTEY